MKNFSTLLPRIAILAGLGLGAFALAASAGTWTPAPATPPTNNVDAPLNVGSLLQEKAGGLWIHSGLKVDGNLIVASGTPAVGKVLTALDGLGTVGWQASTAAGNCTLLISTPALNFTGIYTRSIPVPDVCKNSSCTLFMDVLDSSDNTIKSKSAVLVEVDNTARNKHNLPGYWWSKPASANDGTSCIAGINGVTGGPASACDKIMDSTDGNMLLKDDDATVETSPDSWSVIDANDNESMDIYACK